MGSKWALAVGGKVRVWRDQLQGRQTKIKGMKLFLDMERFCKLGIFCLEKRQLGCEKQNLSRLGEIGGDCSLSFDIKEVGVLNENNRNHVQIRQKEAVYCMVGCRLVSILVQYAVAVEFKENCCGLTGRQFHSSHSSMEESFTKGN